MVRRPQSMCTEQLPAKSAEQPVFWKCVDLRPSLSPYGQTQVHTPNIQKLADNATVFLRAYCQEAVRDVRPVSRGASVAVIQFLMGIFRSAERTGLFSEPQ